MMKRWLSHTRVTAARISSRKGRYCACKSKSGTFIALVSRGGPARHILSTAGLDRSSRLALGLSAFNRLPFVVVLLTFGEADGHFDPAFLEVHPRGHQRHTLFDRLADQLSNFVTMQQELPAAERFVIGVPPMTVGADVDVVEIDLAALDASEAVAQVHAAFPDRLHLGAEQHHASFERLE